MAPKKPSSTTQSFWTTLPGLITAIATLLTAAAGFIVALPHVVRASATSSAIPIDGFRNKTVLEKARYTVLDGSTEIDLLVEDVKVGQRQVFLQIGLRGEKTTPVQLGINDPRLVTVGAKTYEATVHDLADVLLTPDTAQLSLVRR